MRTIKSGTCLCAVKDLKGRIWIAADRRATWDTGRYQKTEKPKVNKRSELILAGTGDCFLINLILYTLEIPELTSDPDIYLQNDFKKAVKNLLASNNLVDEHKILRIPPDIDAEIIIGIKGKCFVMNIFNPRPEGEYTSGLITIDEVSLPYTSGCGEAYAKAILDYGRKKKITNIINLLGDAIEIASDNSAGCGNGWDYRHE